MSANLIYIVQLLHQGRVQLISCNFLFKELQLAQTSHDFSMANVLIEYYSLLVFKKRTFVK